MLPEIQGKNLSLFVVQDDLCQLVLLLLFIKASVVVMCGVEENQHLPNERY